MCVLMSAFTDTGKIRWTGQDGNSKVKESPVEHFDSMPVQ